MVPPIMVAGFALLLLVTMVAVASGWSVPFWWSATLLTLILLSAGICGLTVWRHASMARRGSGRWWWRLFGAPIDAETARALFSSAIWDLIRGAAPATQPARYQFCHLADRPQLPVVPVYAGLQFFWKISYQIQWRSFYL